MQPKRASAITPRLPLKRRNDILQLVRTNGHVNVTEMSAFFEASHDTIRRDLDALAAQGHLRRTHGGAVSLEHENALNVPVIDRRLVNVASKTRIAQQTAGLISDGERLFINGGTTTLFVAKALTSRARLTVLTNNLLVPSVIPEDNNWDLYVLGGRYHAGSQVTTKTDGFNTLVPVTTDTAVVGIGGVSAESGFTVSLFEDAAAIEQMLYSAKRLIVVADASKFGKEHLVPIATNGKPTILVTDKTPDEDVMSWLQSNSVELIVV